MFSNYLVTLLALATSSLAASWDVTFNAPAAGATWWFGSTNNLVSWTINNPSAGLDNEFAVVMLADNGALSELTLGSAVNLFDLKTEVDAPVNITEKSTYQVALVGKYVTAFSPAFHLAGPG